MRKRAITYILSLLFIVFLTSLISAEILINEPPKNLYNLGDTISTSVKVVATKQVNTFFTMKLICDGKETEVYKEFLSLKMGEEKQINTIIPLLKSTGTSAGICAVKFSLDEQYVLTNEFKISNLISIEIKNLQKDFSPGDKMLIEGTAKKENGENVNGFLDVKLITSNSTNLELKDTIKNGLFKINLTIPKEMRAGESVLIVDAYEKDDDEISNEGLQNYGISIKQIPTNLEIYFENSSVEPGTSVRIKTILHDQSGEKIQSESIITIKDSKDKILQQIEKPTEEFFEYVIDSKTPPSEFKVFAVSNKLTSDSQFRVLEKQSIDVQLVNKTIIITNTGNVVYNKTLSVKIGAELKTIETNLKVGESQKYILNAPDGAYGIEILENGEKKLSENNVLLTGNAINIEKVSSGVIRIITHPLVWIFIVVILGFIAFMIFRKGYKRSFFGYIGRGKVMEATPIKRGSMIKSRNKAEVLLSIKGDKQDSSIVCIKIKNLNEIQKSKSNAEEILQNTVNIAEDYKASTYENQDNLIFILAPVITKTFQNEKTALDIAKRVKDVLDSHNKLAKQKINYGISINRGSIVAKKENNMLYFTGIGPIITDGKRIASLSKGEIYIGEKMNEKISSEAKTERHEEGNAKYYTIRELREREKHEKFLSSFVKRLGEDK